MPLEQAEQVLQVYREKHFELNVRHFHEKLGEAYGIGLSYTWVKLALQGAADPAGHCRGCCCIWTGAGTSGFQTSAGMT